MGEPPVDLPRTPGTDYDSPDVRGYEDLDIMLPFVDLLKSYEPKLLDLFMTYGKNRSASSKQSLDQHIKLNWKPNITLIDFDLENRRQIKHTPLLDFTPHEVLWDLLGETPPVMAGQGTRGVPAHLVRFFELVASSSHRAKNQIHIEIVIGDMAAFMERAERHLLEGKRSGIPASSRFPDTYNRVDMSNIPAYVGGPLTTFIHCSPILRDDKLSSITSNNLRNPKEWVTQDQFLTKHLLLIGRNRIEDTFAVSLVDRSVQTEKKSCGEN